MLTPSHDQNETQPDVLSELAWLRWLPLALNFVLAGVVCLLILFFETQRNIAAALIGFLFVQILLAAVWTTLAPIGLLTRVITGTIFVFYLCLCMYYCAYRDGGGTGIAVAITGAMFAQWLIYQIPLWYMRTRGWKLNSQRSATENRREVVQFGIKHLLVWTTIVAAFMGIVQWVSPQMQLETSQTADMLTFGLQLTVGNSLIALPVIWGCLTRYYFWLWIIVAIFACVLVCYLQSIAWGSRTMDDNGFLWIINGTQTAISIIAMLALRLTGLRLNRVVV